MRAGADAVLVNCVAARHVLRYLQGLRGLSVPLGAYGNAGQPDDRVGWLVEFGPPPPDAAARAKMGHRYAGLAKAWVREGATLLGGCCGTFAEHITALRDDLGHEITPRGN